MIMETVIMKTWTAAAVWLLADTGNKRRHPAIFTPVFACSGKLLNMHKAKLNITRRGNRVVSYNLYRTHTTERTTVG